jgi:hypothetical protein
MSSFKKAMKIGCGGALGLAVLLVGALGPCWSAWLTDGILPDTCPDGDPRPVVNVETYGLERGRPGTVEVRGAASYRRGGGLDVRETSLRRFSTDLELRVGDEVLPVECEGWEEWYTGTRACGEATLPEGVPDGDHTLLVHVSTPLEEDVTVEVPLALYVPAAAHVLTDRPLYEPGQTVLFRALTLSRADLTPISDRPGVWTVRGPDGRVYLEEESPGGPWGVSASSFPLAADAPLGTWTVSWRSGRDEATAEVLVQPFTLPRFDISLTPDKPWYTEGDAPTVEGVATYASGAPVSGAAVQVSWSARGSWPPPNEWLEPAELLTDDRGRFELALPEVPADLPGGETVSLTGRVRVVDEGGEQLVSAARVLLSKDPLIVDGVTEIQDGLVGGYSNRVYLRATTPDGQPLGGAELTVKRRWDPRDPGEVATSDASGVIALQLDPGEPVSVTIPAPPWRPPPPSSARVFSPAGVDQLLALPGAGVAERRAMDAIGDRLEAACGHLVSDGQGALRQVVRVRGGRVETASGDGGALGRCADRAVAGQVLGGEGVYQLRWQLQPPELPQVVLNRRTDMPEELRATLAEQALEARECLAPLTARYQDRARGSSQLNTDWSVIWSTTAGSRRVGVELHSGGGELPGLDCLRRHFAGFERAAPSAEGGLGVLALTLQVPVPAGQQRPTPRVMQGYEFEVSAAGVGATLWRSTPGAIPYVRLRPSKVLLDAGEPFEVELLRGPGFMGELPEELTLMRGLDEVQEVELDEESRVARFTPPPEASGFLTVEWGGARALVYAAPAAELSLALSAGEGVYKPGETFPLQIQASEQAVVSLVGVDSRLGQLAPLPGPSSLGESMVTASSASPAFGAFDAVALAMGAVPGENAARAAVLRVSTLEPVSALSPQESYSARAGYDPDEELAEVFYALLPRVRQAVREWESAAAGGELLTNERMAALFDQAVKAQAAAGEPVEDPWGLRVALSKLPDPLLRRLDPRVMTSDGTRLPEDVVDWLYWARMEG